MKLAINRKLLRRVRRFLATHRDRFKYDTYGSIYQGEHAGEECSPTQLMADCGTIGCVAGWTCAIAGADPGPLADAGDLAEELLRLDQTPVNLYLREFLFFASCTNVMKDAAKRMGLSMDDFFNVGVSSSASTVDEAIRRIDWVLANSVHDGGQVHEINS